MVASSDINEIIGDEPKMTDTLEYVPIRHIHNTIKIFLSILISGSCVITWNYYQCVENESRKEGVKVMEFDLWSLWRHPAAVDFSMNLYQWFEWTLKEIDSSETNRMWIRQLTLGDNLKDYLNSKHTAWKFCSFSLKWNILNSDFLRSQDGPTFLNYLETSNNWLFTK